MKLPPKNQRVRIALAGGLAAVLLAFGVDRGLDWYRWHRPGEAHFRGRPTSWWEWQHTRWQNPPAWRAWLESVGAPYFADPLSPAEELAAGDPAAAPVLAELLKRPEAEFSDEVLLSLSHQPLAVRRSYVPALLPLLGEADERVRQSASKALSCIDPESLADYERDQRRAGREAGK
jgi:hypothetical protein